MMNNMRKVILTVSSAKVVNTNPSRAYGSKMKYIETIGRNGDLIESNNDMDNIIHVNHIINALHIMFGARPVSFKYGNRDKLSQKIINIVENGILRYDNVFKGNKTFKNGDTKVVFYNEFTQGKKAVYNSNRNGLTTIASNGETYKFALTWSLLKKKMVYSPQYNEVYNILSDFAQFINCQNMEKDYTLVDFIILMRDKYPEFINKFNNIKNITTIMNIFDKEPGNGSFNAIKSPNLAGLGNINAPTPKVSVNATIILFMNDEDAENLLNGKRYASILDGGFIYIANNDDNNIINSIRDFNVINNVEDYIEEYLDEGFVKINELPYTNGKIEN